MVKKVTQEIFSYVAFLRGIGPGDPKKSNESLKRVFASLGFENVQSFISSGNILFRSKERSTQKLEHIIENGLKEELGIEIGTFVRSKDELAAFLARVPFGERTHSNVTYLIVTFYKKSEQAKLASLAKAHPKKVIKVDTALRAVCSVVDTTALKTPNFMAQLEKFMGKKITTRTVNTVERIVKRF